VSVYVDASVLVALLMVDAFTARTDAFFRINTPVLIVSDFAAAEFASAVARRVRTGDITADEAGSGSRGRKAASPAAPARRPRKVRC